MSARSPHSRSPTASWSVLLTCACSTQDKITPLADFVYMLRSGSASDTQAIASYVQLFIAQHVAEEGDQISVKTAANLVRGLAYQNKDAMEAGMIVAGWDRWGGGQVWGIPLGGTLLQAPFATGGSGSSYIYGWMDKNWRDGMTEEEAKAFVVAAVRYAKTWDAASGGCIRTLVITEAGVKREFMPETEIPPTYGELGRDRTVVA